MRVYKTGTCRWKIVPVDAGITIGLPEGIDLREECICYLLPAELSDRVLTGDYGDYVPFPEGKQVREGNTLPSDDPSAIGKCGCNRKNSIAAERATLRI
jgi:hypothetical protein